MLTTDLATSAVAPSRLPRIRTFRAWRNPARTVLGFISLELASGLIIHHCKLMVGPRGRRWIALPAVQRRGPNNQLVNGENGKPIWDPIVEFCDRETRDRFQEVVIDALYAAHPEVFDGART
jgi:hypothetical protein